MKYLSACNEGNRRHYTGNTRICQGSGRERRLTGKSGGVRSGAVDMPPDVPVQELADLVCGGFCMRTHVFIGFNEGGFNDRLYPLFIQPAETAGDITKAHDRMG